VCHRSRGATGRAPGLAWWCVQLGGMGWAAALGAAWAATCMAHTRAYAAVRASSSLVLPAVHMPTQSPPLRRCYRVNPPKL
jgi:hypothetical protein